MAPLTIILCVCVACRRETRWACRPNIDALAFVAGRPCAHCRAVALVIAKGEERMNRTYLAAPLSQAKVMREWAERLTREGHQIVSTWHDTGDSVDPVDGPTRASILLTNLADLRSANVVLADTRDGVPGGTLCEIGYALGQGIRVIWLQPATPRADGVRHTNVFDAHTLCRVVTDPAGVLPALAWL